MPKNSTSPVTSTAKEVVMARLREGKLGDIKSLRSRDRQSFDILRSAAVSEAWAMEVKRVSEGRGTRP